MNNNIFYPSFEFEEKTKAFNITIWGFVGLISMFSTSLLAYVPYLCLISILDLVSTFFYNIYVLPLIAFIFGLMFGIGCYKFLINLLHSYKFEDNKIIKGRIINPEKVKGIDLAFDTIMTTYMVKNITNSKNVAAANTAVNMNQIINLIKLNTNQEFVNKFFDTDIYKKKIYNNPRLLKETKYSLIYICDENKKLVIPKLYEGMNVTFNDIEKRSFISRILIRSLIVLLVFLLMLIIDLFIGITNNDEYMSNINRTCEILQHNLINYDYNYDISTTGCYFEKKISNARTSTIKYKIDKNGNIISFNLQLYYDYSSYSDSEFRYIISSLNTNLSNSEINNLIERVSSCVSGKCSYGKVDLGQSFLNIGTSSGYVDIHNY